MKIGKYQFKDETTADTKIKALGFEIDEDGNEYPTHNHSVVKLSHITLKEGEYDSNGLELKAPVFSKKYHIDVLWSGLEDHPYGWKSYAVAVADGNGVHSFYGIDYQTNKF